MATFSTNLARLLYVAKSYKSSAVVASDPVGTISVHKNNDGDLYFLYRGVEDVMRSDLIKKSSIVYAKATDALKLARKLKKDEVTLDAAINGGAPVAGQDYILRITFRNWVGLSPQYTYDKFGVVHAFAGMTKAQFFQELKKSLEMNFSRELTPLLKFTLDNDGNPTKLIIEEVELPWSLGTVESVPLEYSIQPDEIISNGDNVIWGKVTRVASTTTVKDGKVIADMEYFYMGERGDVYRNVGFPRVIHTQYLVDSSLEYNTIDMHYYYEGPNEMVQKSEKDITLVMPKVGATLAVSNKLTNDIIGAINTAAGTTMTTLPTT